MGHESMCPTVLSSLKSLMICPRVVVLSVAGQHSAGRARPRSDLGPGPRVRLLQEEAPRQCVSSAGKLPVSLYAAVCTVNHPSSGFPRHLLRSAGRRLCCAAPRSILCHVKLVGW